ncbi:MAG: DUF99 family protein [Methanoregula sp.]|jgi:endonuclease V-like protein UPF0215 family
MHPSKKGLRALGIAESFSGREHSTLAGIVMRKDLKIDGFAFSRVTVGGMDATDAVLEIVNALNRRDINLILLSGCVIAFFNIIDPGQVHDLTGLPVICVTYEESAGLEGNILHHYPGDTARLDTYRRLGTRTPHTLPDGQTMYLRSWGLDPADAGQLCTAFTCEGKIPEPLRVARLAARAAHGSLRNLE